ncbi:MAG: hypothetical protein WC523_07780, partial [Patescibacteria group bacterium]
MELFKNFFKPDHNKAKPVGQPDNLERYFLRPDNIAVERDKNLEEIKRNYQPAMALRERQYDKDVEAKAEIKNQRFNLDTHNKIVLGYADELVRAHDLSEQDKVAVYLAIIF